MNRIVLPAAAVTLIIVGLIGLVFTSAYLASAPESRPSADRDAMFIEQMIPHHDDAIAMAELARSRAEHPELRRLAEEIRREQTAENEQMRDWYRQWYESDVPEGGSPGMMRGGRVDMQALEDAEQFDRAFIEEMIPHHRMAIMMARMVRGSDRPELRDLADSIVRSQSEQIDRMERYYDEWYGR